MNQLSYQAVNLAEKAQLLFEMDVKTFTREFDFPARNVEDTIEYLKDCKIYLAYINNEVVGLFAYQELANHVVEVKQLIVLKKFQGHGYGQELLKQLFTLSAKKIRLVTHPLNNAAIITYLKSGFQLIGWKDNYYGDEQPRLLLEKKLDN